ncbi:hypothetical protein AK830_g2801 [Neonectria ditissima]|uniref:BTB domain-containing protein n=1 Tax=Neonectria ditissima TaxID=78410 RepID=A0A0N8H873_9HYPO|nr:hypothetical protein AK830_g2801 [Neonectria ditissima]
MLISHVDIDPDGDTWVILPHLTSPSSWSEEAPPDEDAPLSSEDGDVPPAGADENPTPANEDEQIPEDAIPPEDVPEEEMPVEETPEECPFPEEPEDPSFVEFHFKVSMKHLTLASRRAKAMFAGNYIESQPQDDGLHHWKFEPLFDPAAFKIVMDAIHGHTQKLPKTVTIKTLAAIATVVDDLECQHALCFFVGIWIDHLGPSIPSNVCDDLGHWILVSFVFNNPGLFKSTTRVAIVEGKAAFPSSGLPIRPKIIETIDTKRESLLELLISRPHALLQRISNDTHCDYECISNVVGTLVHEMMSSRIFLPRPCQPFTGLSVSTVAGMIRNFELPGLYHSDAPGGGYYMSVPSGTWLVYRGGSVAHDEKPPLPDCGGVLIPARRKAKKAKKPELGSVKRHVCDLQTLVEEDMEGIKTHVKGLKLSDFV